MESSAGICCLAFCAKPSATSRFSLRLGIDPGEIGLGDGKIRIDCQRLFIAAAAEPRSFFSRLQVADERLQRRVIGLDAEGTVVSIQRGVGLVELLLDGTQGQIGGEHSRISARPRSAAVAASG